jgi:hypothetical protein
MNASPECMQLLGEVSGYALGHPWLVGRCHQMTVDAYGAQHAGPPTKPIRVAYSLVGLHLALEAGLSGTEVRDAHGRMGKPAADWPAFDRPAGLPTVTILDVAQAGAQVDSPEGHAEAVHRWAEAVWEWWAPAHDDVRWLTRHLLDDWLRRRP